ncbi:MAG: hypothetical protein AB7I09_04285 [Planctomycetota bacterium]
MARLAGLEGGERNEAIRHVCRAVLAKGNGLEVPELLVQAQVPEGSRSWFLVDLIGLYRSKGWNGVEVEPVLKYITTEADEREAWALLALLYMEHGGDAAVPAVLRIARSGKLDANDLVRAYVWLAAKQGGEARAQSLLLAEEAWTGVEEATVHLWLLDDLVEKWYLAAGAPIVMRKVADVRKRVLEACAANPEAHPPESMIGLIASLYGRIEQWAPCERELSTMASFVSGASLESGVSTALWSVIEHREGGPVAPELCRLFADSIGREDCRLFQASASWASGLMGHDWASLPPYHWLRERTLILWAQWLLSDNDAVGLGKLLGVAPTVNPDKYAFVLSPTLALAIREIEGFEDYVWEAFEREELGCNQAQLGLLLLEKP